MSTYCAINDLKEREKMIEEREKALNEREKMICEREKALEEIEKKTNKPICVIKYDRIYDQIKDYLIGHFEDEKEACHGVISYLVKNKLDGFDESIVNEIIQNEADEIIPDYMEEDALIEYLLSQCNNWDELMDLCRYYGSSYFEDGWWLSIKHN